MRKLIAAALLLAPLASRADQKLRKEELPPAVLASVARKYPSARQTGFEKEMAGDQPRFEVRLEQGSEVIEVLLAADGTIVSEETEVAEARLPAAVREGLHAGRYASWSVERSERIVPARDPAQATYELVLHRGTRRREVVFDGSGKLLKDEPFRD